MSMKRILVVDDEENVRNFDIDLLSEWDYEPKARLPSMTPADAEVDLILVDTSFPDQQSFEIVGRIRQDEHHGTVPIIVVTASDSQEERTMAVRAGATDLIARSGDATKLRARVNSLLGSHTTQDETESRYAELEKLVRLRTTALFRTHEEMARAKAKTEQAYLDMIRRLVMAAEYRDATTALHLHRMREYCIVLAEGLSMTRDEIVLIAEATPLHDIGKIAIPDAILLKPGRLTAKEWIVMKSHVTVGGKMLTGSSSELLQAGEVIALSHHEKWDGSGYPAGLAGVDIPLWGRICAIADVFDALTSTRPYKQAFSNEVALDIIVQSRGQHFEPVLVDLFVERFAEIERIQLAGLRRRTTIS